MLYGNCRSVLNKIDELRAVVYDLKPHIICLNESWTNSQHSDALISISGYGIVCRYDRTDTENGIGGGLLIYAKHGICVSENMSPVYRNFNQCCAVKLPVKNGQSIELVLVYRPHKLYDGASVQTNNMKLNEVMSKAPHPAIIVGDFNYSDIDWEVLGSDSHSRSFLETVQDCFLHQHVGFPTRDCSSTMPDLVFSSSLNSINSVQDVGRLGKSDHVMLMIKVAGEIDENVSYEEVPDWCKADINKLKQTLAHVDWNKEIQGSTLDSWTKFKDILQNAQEQCVPKKRRRIGNKPLWMNQNIMRTIRKKRRLWRTYTDTRDYQQYQAYKKIEQEVQNAVKRAKRKLERKLAKNAKKSPKPFYSYLNSKTSNRQTVGPLKEGEQTVDDNQKMATLLNMFFSSVFTKEDTSYMPNPEKTYFGDIPLSDITIEEDKIQSKIRNLNPSSAGGPDKNGPRLLIEVCDEISYPLALIFTKSLVERCVPSDWKKANVTPIFKKGSKSEVGNYRPVSLTSVICKIMESLIKDAIMQHIALNNIIAPTQHGFMPNKSCLTNLLEYLETLTKLVDEGHSADVVYLDFAKAFDKVPHQRLLLKLEAAGITGNLLGWIQDWLSNRMQRVVLNGKCSEWAEVISGVPQGSVLGPALFILYINDIDGVTTVATVISKFADDTKLICKVNVEEDSIKLQTEINNLYDWSMEWQMLFNSSKCKVMHFGRKNPQVYYTMNGHAPAGTVLDIVNVEKDLGVIIHTSLKPSKQCAVAAKKANMVLGQMSKAFTYRDRYTWIRLYKQYVRPHLEYAVQAWSPWTEEDINLLESVQKRAVKMTSGLKSQDYEGKLRELNLTTLQDRRRRGDLIEVWKMLQGIENINVATFFTLVDDYSNRTTRLSGSLMLAKPKANLDIRKNFFTHRVIDHWNNLPYHIKNASSINNFKKSYDDLYSSCCD